MDELTPQELVRQRYPTARVSASPGGKWFYVCGLGLVQETISESEESAWARAWAYMALETALGG